MVSTVEVGKANIIHFINSITIFITFLLKTCSNIYILLAQNMCCKRFENIKFVSIFMYHMYYE